MFIHKRTAGMEQRKGGGGVARRGTRQRLTRLNCELDGNRYGPQIIAYTWYVPRFRNRDLASVYRPRCSDNAAQKYPFTRLINSNPTTSSFFDLAFVSRHYQLTISLSLAHLLSLFNKLKIDASFVFKFFEIFHYTRDKRGIGTDSVKYVYLLRLVE